MWGAISTFLAVFTLPTAPRLLFLEPYSWGLLVVRSRVLPFFLSHFFAAANRHFVSGLRGARILCFIGHKFIWAPHSPSSSQVLLLPLQPKALKEKTAHARTETYRP